MLALLLIALVRLNLVPIPIQNTSKPTIYEMDQYCEILMKYSVLTYVYDLCEITRDIQLDITYLIAS